jgi:hypothetical protein
MEAMKDDVRWYTQHRQEWIAETLRVFGFINRVHIERKFGLSTPQASKDLQTYLREHPDAVEYNLNAKCYQSKKANEA